MADVFPVPGSLYLYGPNKGAAIFFAATFLICGLVHQWQMYHYKCFRLMVFFTFCCSVFVGGFVLRAYGAWHYDKIIPYMVCQILIYTPPPVFELANFHILGRVLYYIPYLSPIHPGRVLTTFGLMCAVVEFLNALGVAYVAGRSVSMQRVALGERLLKASLIVQVFVLGLFTILAVYFHRRCAKFGIRRGLTTLWTLYASTALIFTRTIYRMVEHFSFSLTDMGPGFNLNDLSPMLRYEWYFYVFEATIMLANVILWNAMHPRRFLPKSHRTYLAQDGVTELDGPGWKDKRPFVMTLLDPFNVMDMLPKRNRPQPFWEVNGFADARPIITPTVTPTVTPIVTPPETK